MPASGEKRLDNFDPRDFVEYHPNTGLFTWKVSRYSSSRKIVPGTIAGSIQEHGYIVIVINKRSYRASRLAWFIMTGEFPPKGHIIDHKDQDKGNNRWSNLRLATESQNRMNMKPTSLNKSGQRGVSFRKDIAKWHARIKLNGKTVLLGNFDSLEDAVAARKAAEPKYFGEFAAAS
jgi:hypothetical protein